MSAERGRPVYSTGPEGATSTRADTAKKKIEPQPVAGGQRLVLRRETAGRKGKIVTVVDRVCLGREDAEALLQSLKKRCGAGGTLKESATPDGRRAFALEIQGDHIDTLAAELESRGHRVAGAKQR